MFFDFDDVLFDQKFDDLQGFVEDFLYFSFIFVEVALMPAGDETRI